MTAADHLRALLDSGDATLDTYARAKLDALDEAAAGDPPPPAPTTNGAASIRGAGVQLL